MKESYKMTEDEEKNLVKEALKEMGSTLVVIFITVVFSTIIIGLPGLIAVALGYDFTTGFAVGFSFYLVTIFLLLWFMAEYESVKRKHESKGKYWEGL